MLKVKKLSLLCICFVLLGTMLTGCKGKSDKKSVSVNVWSSSVTFSKVNFYDFRNDKIVKNYSQKCYALSNSLSSKELWIQENNTGNVKAICVDKALSKKPSKVKMYTNSKKTSYDTYSCSY